MSFRVVESAKFKFCLSPNMLYYLLIKYFISELWYTEKNNKLLIFWYWRWFFCIADTIISCVHTTPESIPQVYSHGGYSCDCYTRHTWYSRWSFIAAIWVFFETQTELGNLINLPNFPAKFAQILSKLKNPLNVSKIKIKIKIFISFGNVLNLY